MVELNSNPEILLRKRKNADRVRIEKQEQIRARQQEQARKKTQRKGRFVRAESLVAKTLASRREQERVKRVTKVERTKLVSNTNSKSYISKVSADGSKSKQVYAGKPTLYFIVRTPGPHGAKIPSKVQKVLALLRLNHINTGVFVKLTETIYPLLKLISPYTVIGQPSLQTVRQLVQKRAKVSIEQDGETKQVKLNDNNLVEEKLGEEGIICIEDIIHEIVALGDQFKIVTHFLDPFVLHNDIVGYGPLAKLQKMEKEQAKKLNKTSNSGSAPVLEIDIDDFIAQLN